MNKSENVIDLIKDLKKFREQVKQPPKNAENPFTKSKYADLSAVIQSVDEGIAGTGLSWTQDVTNTPDGVTVQTVLFHDTGQFIEFSPLTMPVGKGTAQEVGSAETYARRYTLQSAFGLVADTDDDGNSASGRTAAAQQPSRQGQQQSRAQRQERTQRQPQPQTPPADLASDADKAPMLDAMKEFARLHGIDGNKVFTDVIAAANMGPIKWGVMTKDQLKAVSDAFYKMSATAPDAETVPPSDDDEPPLPF